MSEIYDFLQDSRSTAIGKRHWLGNLRWFAQEGDAAGSYVLKTAPVDASECEMVSVYHDEPAAIRTLLGLELVGAGGLKQCVYRSDGMTATFSKATMTLLLPLERYGAVITLESEHGARLHVKTSGDLGRRPVVAKSFGCGYFR